MKTKLLKSSLSILLVLLLCVSVMAPAFYAAQSDVTAVAADGDVLKKHAGSVTIAKSELQTIFGDSTAITNTNFYGYAPVPAEGTELDTSTIVYVSNSATITEGDWLALKTTAYTGGLLNRKPDWTNADKRSQLNFSVRTYYNATFSVVGCSDGALYLNNEAVDGQVRLYTDSTYTVTAQDVEGFTYEVTDVFLGEEFSPEADLNVTATYTPDASATVALSVGEGGSAKIVVDGSEVTDTVPAGKSFEVAAIPNDLKGFKLDSIVVTKDGEEVEAVDDEYGPVADGEEYEINVTFIYDPAQVSLDVDADDSKLERSDLDSLFDGGYSYYGIAEENTPDDIVYLYDYNLLITHYKNDYDVTDGKYVIYGSNDGSVTTPTWTNAKLMELTVRTYYNSTFTVSGNDEGEIYLNGETAVNGTKLYTDTEYTVTAKNIDEYNYTMDGAEDGVAFTPSSDVNVTVTYSKVAFATFTLNANEGGTAAVQVNGEAVTDRVSEGDSFTVVATPNENKGYKLDSIVVTKDGEEVEAVDGAYGPVADDEEYEITVTFIYDPAQVSLDVDANDSKLERSDLDTLFDGAYSYYGIAEENTPDTIVYLYDYNLLITHYKNDYDVTDGKYIIYGTNEGSVTSPTWTNAKLMELTVRTYYNSTFTVSGNDEGEIYLNGETAVNGTKLYTDTEYTVTAKNIDEYNYTMDGAEDGVAFTPTSDVNVTVTYSKLAYATFTLNANEGGTAEVQVNGEAVTDRVSEGELFTIVATPNTNRGYKVESIIVKKDGEIIESGDGIYGPVADGEEYEITVTFIYDPPRVIKEVDANRGQVSRNDVSSLFESSYSYYGIAPKDDPADVTYLAIALTADYNVVDGETYIIYGSNDGNILSPRWTNAKLMEMTVRTYYNGTFTVTGNEDGEVYLNGEAIDGSTKLYVDTEYTVTAKEIDDYFYTVEGAEDGVAFTPSADVNVTAAYFKIAYATFSLRVTDGGTAEVQVNGEAVADRISEGDSFEVVATPNANKGYKLDSIVVSKDGEEVEAVDGVYGPVADGEEYAITVTFVYDPPRVEKEVDANKGQVSRNDLNEFFDGAYNYYGIAPKSDPDNISYLAIALTSNYNVENGGEYVIYGSNDGNILSPRWTNAKLMEMTVRTYYNGAFTVTGNDEGEIYLNDEAISGNTKLYVDTEYTVTAKSIDEYGYIMEGAEDGVAFTPSADVNVTVTYTKLAYATFTLDVSEGGTAEVQVNGEAVTDRVSEGDSFTVVATPNANRGYAVDSIVVTKDSEEVEAVDGAYGPVTDDEEYEITVTFKYDPPQVTKDVNANEGDISRSDVSGLFNGAYSYYGIATTDAPDDVTYLAIALTADYDVVDGETYIIYGTNDGNILSPKWTNAKLMEMTVRMYYNGTFTVNAPADIPEAGEIYLNGEAVTGSVKLYTDEAYTVTSKEIEEYICTVYGVEEGVEFTPTENVDVTAVYMKETYATITVNANDGGTVAVTSDGTAVFDKLPEGDSFAVTVTADADNAYYVDSFVVLKDGVEVEAVDGVYGPVADGESYEINVTFTQATLSFDDCDVVLVDIKNGDLDKVEQDILANTELLPVELASNANFKVEYAAYSVLGLDIYEPLNFTGLLSHAFGTSSLGGELLDGNTEKVRVTVELPDYDITLQALATVTVRDIRIPTRVEGESITITYGDDLKAAVMNVIKVYDVDDVALEFTADDITINPESLNANLLSAFRAQDVTVTYGGTDEYAASSGTVSVYVRRAQSSLDTKSETITYGEIPAAEVITTPEDLDYIKVIAGIDGDAQGFVSIDIPESVKDRMKIKVGDVVLFDIYEYLSSRIGEGTTIDGLKNLVLDIYDRVASNEIIRQAIENSGFNMEILDTIVGYIENLPELDTNLKIRLGQVPTNAGAYLMFAVSTDTNYTTSADASTIIIRPQSTDEDTTVELRFREEMQGEEGLQYLSYEEAQEFTFGGDFYIDDVVTETEKLHTLYVGTTYAGDVIAQEEPVRVPGIYTETVYILGGNYWAEPIVRAYTINRIETPLAIDDLTVPYDGEAHAIEAYMEDGSDLPEGVTYTYIGVGYLSSEAPVNAGEYLVNAYYAGTDTIESASVTATLTIERLDATITMTCADEITYGDVNLFNVLTVADIGYTVEGTINDDTLGVIVSSLDLGVTFPNVGEYPVSAIFVQTNFNYNVTIEDAVLKIVPREITFTIDNKEKEFGDEDPELTYQVENLAFRDKLDVTLSREEGEEIGEYLITAEIAENLNYTIAEFEDGVFTITTKKLVVTIDDATKEVGDDDPDFTYTLTDTAGNPVDPDEVGLVISRDVGNKIGEYAIFVHRVENSNYEIDEEASSDGVLTITTKKITVVIDSVSKVVGEEDPTFTYTVTNKDGETVNPSKVGLTLAREEGEEVGTYEIYVDEITNTNYEINEETSVNGTLTIEEEPQPAPSILLGDVDGDGEVTSFDVAFIQRYLAFMDIPFEMNEAVGDVDGDGEITSFDVTFIQRWLAYMDVPYPIGEYIEG